MANNVGVPRPVPLETVLPYVTLLAAVAAGDVRAIFAKENEYRGSWLKRGGTGAFHAMWRKADRIEIQVERFGYDIFQAAIADHRDEGLLDDVRDFRRYLLMVDTWLIHSTKVPMPTVVDPSINTVPAPDDEVRWGVEDQTRALFDVLQNGMAVNFPDAQVPAHDDLTSLVSWLYSKGVRYHAAR